MKLFKNYLSALAVLALVFTSCSKEESSALDDANSEFVELTFGATLNDLANRAANKSQHFDAIPTCSDNAPDYARINFSYGGQSYEVVVDILQDANGYYTDYSESLKIPVNGGSTAVTLTGFLVYDSSHTIIWAAPVGSGLANYVDSALPRTFNVAAGTKPYIDIEVLCFDRRMVNEYGYVFFDIVPDTIYPLCTFINYCNEAGRHWVANYSIDLYYGTNDEGIQLYDNADADARVTVGTRGGQYYADPLCLVVPGPPANLPNDQPYLYMVIHPNDWSDNYGDIDNSPVAVQLSWNDVNELLNSDGTTNEYLHLFIGECPGALDGEGGNGGGPSCNLNDPNADCDNDSIPNRCDADNPNWETFDCDGDNVPNAVDNCVTQVGPASNNGCPESGFTCEGNRYDFGNIADCQFAYINGNPGFINITGEIPLFLAYSGQNAQNSVGALTVRINAEGDLEISGDLTGIANVVTGFEITVTDGANYCENYSLDIRNNEDAISDAFSVNLSEEIESLPATLSYPFQVMVKALICPAN